MAVGVKPSVPTALPSHPVGHGAKVGDVIRLVGRERKRGLKTCLRLVCEGNMQDFIHKLLVRDVLAAAYRSFRRPERLCFSLSVCVIEKFDRFVCMPMC